MIGVLAAALVLAAAHHIASQDLRIGIIDFYGLRHVSEAQARAALTVKEGDTVVIGDGPPAFVAESKRRLSALPGVVNAYLNVVCCDGGAGILYVGIDENP